MRALKLIVNAFVLFVFLPVFIVAVLGVVFSPLQPTARAVEPRTAFEANDIMWEGAAENEVLPVATDTAETEKGSDQAFDLEAESEPLELAVEASNAVEPEATEEAAAELAGQSAVAEEPAMGESPSRYSSEQLRAQGVIRDGARRYTWYSQRVLPGGGLDIDGRHVSGEGYVVDSQERIVVASSDLPWGTELEVPFGSGRAVVLDTGCAPGTIDVYTDF